VRVLYVSLGELLDLEKEVSVLAGQTGLGTFVPEVSPEQLRGIEADPYARELTQVSIWIGYLQWMKENGFGSPGPHSRSYDKRPQDGRDPF
jgi:hypothetical protein